MCQETQPSQCTVAKKNNFSCLLYCQVTEGAGGWIVPTTRRSRADPLHWTPYYINSLAKYDGVRLLNYKQAYTLHVHIFSQDNFIRSKVCKFTNQQLDKSTPTSLKLENFSSLQLEIFTHLQIFKFTTPQVCKLASSQVYKFWSFYRLRDLQVFDFRSSHFYKF